MVKARLTKAGKFILALMLLFYVASVTSQSGLLLLFIGLAGGCFAVNWSFSRRNASNVKLTPPKEVWLVEGSASNQPWRFENPSQKHIEMIEVTGDAGPLFRVPFLKVGDAISVLPGITYERRGFYPHSQVTISSAAPYGLIRATRSLRLEGEVVVLPRVYETASPAGTGLDLIAGGKFRGGRRVNTGTHFAGVRSWQPGDSLKQVHWKTTARRDQLMVKTFEEELGGRVSLILDCDPADTRLVDNAVRAAASLAVASLQEGHHLELIDSSEREALRLASFSDERELLERLARYAAHPVHNLEITKLWRKSAVAIVGTTYRAAWLTIVEEAQRQNRRAHIFLPEETKISPTSADCWHFSHNEINSASAEGFVLK